MMMKRTSTMKQVPANRKAALRSRTVGAQSLDMIDVIEEVAMPETDKLENLDQLNVPYLSLKISKLNSMADVKTAKQKKGLAEFEEQTQEELQKFLNLQQQKHPPEHYMFKASAQIFSIKDKE